MKANGRRRWRKWARRHSSLIRGRPPVATLRRHWSGIGDLPARPFTARSLCGMSQGARKRRALDASVTRCGPEYAAHRAAFRVGERLRPCPGCKSCGVRRFRKVGGFGDGTAYIEHRPGGCRLYRHRGGRWIFRPNDRRRWHTAQHYPLPVCAAYVANGTWEELTTERCTDGLLPARKARKARG